MKFDVKGVADKVGSGATKAAGKAQDTLDSSVQHIGLGRKLFSYLENKLVNKGATSIRIDVVNDYVPNLISFWESLGFAGKKEESLTWGDKTSKVLVMTKNLL